MSSSGQYSTDLDKNDANYSPLSPLTFIERAASVYPERVALINAIAGRRLTVVAVASLRRYNNAA
jgi:hypothetical protein